MYIKLKRKLKSILSTTVLYSWVLSYLLVFAVPFAASFLIYSQGSKALIKQITTTYSQSLTGVATRTDDFLLKLNYIASSVSSSRDLSDYISATRENGGVPNYSFVAFSKLLSNQKNTLPSDIDMIYFYAYGSKYVISSNGVVPQDDFFDMYYGENKPDKNELLSKFSYASYRVIGENTDFIYSFPLKETGLKPDAFLVIKLNKGALLNLFSDSVDIEGSNVYIIDKFNNVILEKQSFNNDIVEYDSYNESNATNNGKIVTITAKSNYNSWKYVTEISVKTIMTQMKFARMLLCGLSVLSLILGLLMIIYSIKHNYSGLMKAVKVAKSVSLDKNSSGMNEYDIILNALSDYRKHIWVLADLRYKKYKNQREALLYRLMKDGYSDAVLTKLKEYDVEFKSDKFIIVYINPLDYEDIELEYNAEYDEKISEEESISSFVISNVLEDLFTDYGTIYPINHDSNSFFVLININEGDGKEYEKKLTETLKYANDFVRLNFGFGFDAFLSSKHTGVKNIHEAYIQVIRVKNYCASYNLKGVVICEDILENTVHIKNYKKSVSYIFEFIRQGNLELATKLFGTVFDGFEEKASIYDIQIFAFSVCYMAIDTVTEVTEGEVSPYIMGIFDDINSVAFSSTDTAYLREKLMNLIIKTSDAVGVETRGTEYDTEGDFIDEVKKYIDENYKNPDFYMNSIGDHFNKTPYYISNCFKNREKISILNYISTLRIEAAKEMMIKSDKTFAEIAELVGFNNFRNFNRTFKKIEGITPSQFKKMSSKR